MPSSKFSLMQTILKNAIHRMLEKRGKKIVSIQSRDLTRRFKLLSHFGIDKILDVGANVGQYASQMRKFGFRGEIISFEPMQEAFAALTSAASVDPLWKTNRFALGDEDTESEINIAGNSISSSILEIMPLHQSAAPKSVFVQKEKIIVKRLDQVFDTFYQKGDNILLKIDTQGYEMKVLKGAEESLAEIKGIQLEMSLVELYKGETLYTDMIAYLKDHSFQLYSLEPGFSSYKTGQLLQMDGIFYKQ